MEFCFVKGSEFEVDVKAPLKSSQIHRLQYYSCETESSLLKFFHYLHLCMKVCHPKIPNSLLRHFLHK